MVVLHRGPGHEGLAELEASEDNVGEVGQAALAIAAQALIVADVAQSLSGQPALQAASPPPGSPAGDRALDRR